MPRFNPPAVRHHAQRLIVSAPQLPRIMVPVTPPMTVLVPPQAAPVAVPPRPNPYGHFRRVFTDAGGIRLDFMDAPVTWLEWIGNIAVSALFGGLSVAVAGFTVLGAQFFDVPLIARGLLALAAASAFYSWLFDWSPSRRSIEIRPECMILDGRDVFWRGMMELGLPSLNYSSVEGAWILSGTLKRSGRLRRRRILISFSIRKLTDILVGGFDVDGAVDHWGRHHSV